MSDFYQLDKVVINCQKKRHDKVMCRTCRSMFKHDDTVKVKIGIWISYTYCKECVKTRPKTKFEKQMEGK